MTESIIVHNGRRTFLAARVAGSDCRFRVVAEVFDGGGTPEALRVALDQHRTAETPIPAPGARPPLFKKDPAQ